MVTKQIRQSELNAYLKQTFTIKTLVRKADITTQYATLVLGGLEPSKKVLKRLGIKIVYEVPDAPKVEATK